MSVVPIRADMLSRIMADPPASRSFNPKMSGYRMLYRGVETACPGCGRNHWLVGRSMAECAFCSTALPLGEP